MPTFFLLTAGVTATPHFMDDRRLLCDFPVEMCGFFYEEF